MYLYSVVSDLVWYWLVVWLPFFIFPSQLTNSYFSEGWPWPTNQDILSNRNLKPWSQVRVFELRDHHGQAATRVKQGSWSQHVPFFWGTHGDPWGPMGTHGDPWGSRSFQIKFSNRCEKWYDIYIYTYIYIYIYDEIEKWISWVQWFINSW